MIRKKRFVALGCFAVAVIAAAAIFLTQKSTGDPIVFYVDGEPVYSQEAEFVIARERLLVRNQIINEYDMEEGEFSWDEEYDGITPLDQLKSTVIQECTQNKIIQIVARETGVADDIDYPSIREMNEEDTKAREERTQAGEVIYGNMAYQEADFYDYVLSNLEQQTYYRLVEEGMLQITDEEIQAIYEENRESMEEAGADESVAETMGLQQKYAEYIRRRTEEAEVDHINEKELDKVLERAK